MNMEIDQDNNNNDDTEADTVMEIDMENGTQYIERDYLLTNGSVDTNEVANMTTENNNFQHENIPIDRPPIFKPKFIIEDAHNEAITSVKLSPDNRWIASCCMFFFQDFKISRFLKEY